MIKDNFFLQIRIGSKVLFDYVRPKNWNVSVIVRCSLLIEEESYIWTVRYANNAMPCSLSSLSQSRMCWSFSFNSGLLDEKYVKKIRDHFEFVLMQIVENSERSLNEIDLLTHGRMITWKQQFMTPALQAQ